MVYRTGFTTLNIKIMKVKVISYDYFAFQLNIYIIIELHNSFQKDIWIFRGHIFLWNFDVQTRGRYPRNTHPQPPNAPQTPPKPPPDPVG